MVKAILVMALATPFVLPMNPIQVEQPKADIQTEIQVEVEKNFEVMTKPSPQLEKFFAELDRQYRARKYIETSA